MGSFGLNFCSDFQRELSRKIKNNLIVSAAFAFLGLCIVLGFKFEKRIEMSAVKGHFYAYEQMSLIPIQAKLAKGIPNFEELALKWSEIQGPFEVTRKCLIEHEGCEKSAMVKIDEDNFALICPGKRSRDEECTQKIGYLEQPGTSVAYLQLGEFKFVALTRSKTLDPHFAATEVLDTLTSARVDGKKSLRLEAMVPDVTESLKALKEEKVKIHNLFTCKASATVVLASVFSLLFMRRAFKHKGILDKLQKGRKPLHRDL